MRRLMALGIVLALLVFGCVQYPPTNITGNSSNNSTTFPPGYEVKDYCQKDGDCVRLEKCCDCGDGEYVNQYHQAPPCTGPRCMCAIRDTVGKCQMNRCVASPRAPLIGFSFNSSHGVCGNDIMPQRFVTADGIRLNGSIGLGSSCRVAIGELKKIDGSYSLNISTRAIPGIAACVNCNGTIPWEANITGYTGDVLVYYDGRLVYPANGSDDSGFCGWSTNASCSIDSDCVIGGCSGQVCQSASEKPIITSCEYSACYDANAYGKGCGCSEGKCRWH
jgi:eight-cysteine-cluster-containing protein